ncbi:Sas10 C-terminal domain-containing protein, partial [Tribonema minus]
GGKRAASYEIIKNRGLTPHKSKLNRNPRVKKREAYRKAVIRRKGQVREVRTNEAGRYAGEGTGIRSTVTRGRKFAS